MPKTAPVGDVVFPAVGISESVAFKVIAVIARINAIATKIITLLLFPIVFFRLLLFIKIIINNAKFE